MTCFITPAAVLAAMLMFATANPSIDQQDSTSKLSFKSKITAATPGSVGVVAADRARVEHIKSQAGNKDAFSHGNIHSRAKHTINVANSGVTYTTSVRIGNESETHELLIDTGSSNTWLGLQQYLALNSTSYTSPRCNETEYYGISYGSGLYAGYFCYDDMRLSDNLVVRNQTFGSCIFAYGSIDDVDGIIGIGPAGLTVGTVQDQPDRVVPTITDNLFAQGTIKTETIGIYYEPVTRSSVNRTSGELTFGGVDQSKVRGPVRYTPVTTTAPSSEYWGINQTLAYGQAPILPYSVAGVVDTGTTLIYLATEAYSAYAHATGAVFDDQNTHLLSITEEQYKALKPLTFNMGSAGNHTLSPNAQIWPRDLNSLINGTEMGIYLIVQDLGAPLGQGLDFINGYTFLERFYTVYDTTHSRFGIAPTAFTYATTN